LPKGKTRGIIRENEQKRRIAMKKLLTYVAMLALLLGCLCAVQLPASAATEGDYTYSVYNGKATITGYTGIAIKGGDVLVDNSQIYGTGASVDPQPSMSGWSDTGDGIYVEDNYGVNISVVITGEHTTVKSDNRYAVECFEPNSDHVSIVIKGGTFVPPFIFIYTKINIIQFPKQGLHQPRLQQVFPSFCVLPQVKHNGRDTVFLFRFSQNNLLYEQVFHHLQKGENRRLYHKFYLHRTPF
jgi:hypothetical protein